LRSRRIQRIAAGKRQACESGANNLEITRENFCALCAIKPKAAKADGIAASPNAEFKSATRHQVENRGIFRHPYGIFQRKRDDPGPEANTRRLRRDEAEKSERSRKSALGLVEMVLRDPSGIRPRLPRA
jgi:hypothetical protein